MSDDERRRASPWPGVTSLPDLLPVLRDPAPADARDVAAILDAVAEMDVFSEGDDDWPYCPFDCDTDFTPYDATPRQHAADCPITLARRLVARRAS